MPCPSQFDKIYEIDYPDDEKKRIRRRYIDSEINSDSDDYCDRSSEYFMMNKNKNKHKNNGVDDLAWPTKFESGYLGRIKIRGKYSWVDKDVFDYKYYDEYLYNMKIQIIKIIEKKYL